MIPETTLAMSGAHHRTLRRHLFPGDGLEASAILICASVPPPRVRLLVRQIICIPHGECKRASDCITWPGQYIEEAIDVAESESLAIFLIHSHPNGYLGFSAQDDDSDNIAMRGLMAAVESRHGTAVMVPDGTITARLYDTRIQPKMIDLVSVAGDDLKYFWADGRVKAGTRPMAFTGEMTAELGGLTVGVIGASGTGSPTLEQVSRLGFGRVYPIDDDRVEKKNLNRILSSSLDDVEAKALKTDVACAAITRHRGEGVAMSVPLSINTREAVLVASQCDVLIGNTDTHSSRHFLDRMGAAFLIPLFDAGVSIPVMKPGGNVKIADVCGRIDYVQPGGSTLQDRGVYSPKSLRAEYLRTANPEAYANELEAGYFRGTTEEAPSVITLNMRASSACVNEFIARAYPFRHESNRCYARTKFSLAACDEEHISEDAFSAAKNSLLARGGVEPLLGIPSLGE